MFSRGRLYIILCLLLICMAAAAHADLRGRVAESSSGFKDLTVSCKVVHANAAELKKIGKDFPKSFEFKNTTAWCKVSHKMRMEGVLGMIRVALIMNGDYKGVVVPSLHITKKENIKAKPDRRQTEFDLGVITESFWDDYVVQDTSTEKDSDGIVYRITFVHSNARDRKQICWIDDNGRLLKLEKYRPNGSLECKYVFSKHTKYDGVLWVPGRADVYNAEGKLAASTVYENVKVNTDLPDSVFKL